MAGDRLYDAQHSSEEEMGYSPFIEWNDGVPSKVDNPWMSAEEQKAHRAKREEQFARAQRKSQRAKKAAEKAKAAPKPNASDIKEGVLGSDHREKVEFPKGKFDFAAWKQGKGPKSDEKDQRSVKKPDPNRFNDLDS